MTNLSNGFFLICLLSFKAIVPSLNPWSATFKCLSYKITLCFRVKLFLSKFLQLHTKITSSFQFCRWLRTQTLLSCQRNRGDEHTNTSKFWIKRILDQAKARNCKNRRKRWEALFKLMLLGLKSCKPGNLSTFHVSQSRHNFLGLHIPHSISCLALLLHAFVNVDQSIENQVFSCAGWNCKTANMSKWIDRIFGSGEIRQYGEHEYYEYPRNGMSGGPGSYEPSSGSGYVAWQGPSIFEVIHHIIHW